jgi:hypothetical protein
MAAKTARSAGLDFSDAREQNPRRGALLAEIRIDGRNNPPFRSSTFRSAQLSPAVRSQVDQFKQGGTMYSRIISCTIDTAKLNDFRKALNDQFLPQIQSQPGFVDNIESLDPATGQFSCMTLWKTSSDVENYNNGLFQEVASKLSPLMKGSPNIQTLPVENSSVHHVKAGKAAA